MAPKGKTSKGKQILDFQSEKTVGLRVIKGEPLHCGSNLKTAGRLYKPAAEFSKYFCHECNRSFKTPNEHEIHNTWQHPKDQICECCLNPTNTPAEHCMEYCSAALMRLKNEGKLVEKGQNSQSGVGTGGQSGEGTGGVAN